MKGGSKASDLVMATEPKLCDGKVSPVITGPKIQGNVSDFKLYRTTGGGKKNKKEEKEQLEQQQEQLEQQQQEQLEEKQQEQQENKQEQQEGDNKGNNMVNKNNMVNNNNNMMNNKNNEKEGLKTKPKRKSSKSKKNRNRKSKSGRGNRSRRNRNISRRNRSRRNRNRRNKRKNMAGGSPASDLVMRGEHPGKINYCPQTNKVGGGKKRRTKRRLRKQKGSGSDWKMTLYSRGPVNNPNQNPDDFRMFTQTAEFIPNEALRAGKFTK